jgi:WD40 repeat protein
LLTTLKGHNDAVNWVSFSPDGKLMASASSDGTVNLWKWDSWSRKEQPILSLKGHNGAVNGVSFSPDGKLIASASEDRKVNLWSRDGNLIKTLEGHSAEVYGVSFSPDGRWLASASADTSVILWNLDLNDLLQQGCTWLHDYLKNPNRLRISDAISVGVPDSVGAAGLGSSAISGDSRGLCEGIPGISTEFVPKP